MLVAGCSIFGDFTGYSGGAAADSGPENDPLTDGGTSDVTPDASSDTSSAGDADSGPDGRTFVDEFDRADGPVGNGWIEKTPYSVGITGGRLSFLKAGVYETLLVTRPPSEDVRDVEVTGEFLFLGTPETGSSDAQLFARVQQATIGMPGGFHGYIFWVEDYVLLKLGRQAGADIVDYIAEKPLPSKVDVLHAYRLRLRVTGTSPVELHGSLEQRSRLGSEWTPVTELSATDDASTRIQNAGTVGTAADEIAPYYLESFTRTAL